MSDSVRPHRRQPTRLPCPWDSPGKNTGVGCHFLLQCMEVKRESEVAQSYPTLSDPMDCSPPGSSPWDFPGKSAGVGCQLGYSKHRMDFANYRYNFLSKEAYKFSHILIFFWKKPTTNFLSFPLQMEPFTNYGAKLDANEKHVLSLPQKPPIILKIFYSMF